MQILTFQVKILFSNCELWGKSTVDWKRKNGSILRGCIVFASNTHPGLISRPSIT